MIKKIVKDIEEQLQKYAEKNFIQDDIYKNHLDPVRTFALELADIYNADKEVVEIAALLHDFYYIKTLNHEAHEIEGAKLAEELLKDKIPKEKVELIIKCVKHHRGSKGGIRESIEEQIIACADAMSHLNNSLNFMYVQSGEGKGLEESKDWLKSKIERSWKKINLPKAREIIREKYDAIQILLKEK